jgi:hypothetical protein
MSLKALTEFPDATGENSDRKDDSFPELRHEIQSSVSFALEQKIGDLDLDAKGYRDDRMEEDFDGTPNWFADHTSRTNKGSLMIGTIHGEEPSEIFEKFVLSPIGDHALRALAVGRRVVFLAEGAVHGPDDSDQQRIADYLDTTSNNRVEHDTWDGSETEICRHDEDGKNLGVDFNLPLVQKLLLKFHDKASVEAALYAMMKATGGGFPVSAEAVDYLGTFGIDSGDETALFKSTFPSAHENDSPLAIICREYNRLRDENMLRKIKEIEKLGAVAIVTPGASHAYSLKHILENGLY